MHTLFHVHTSDIKALNDEQARALIARLCRAEIRKRRGSESDVCWGGDQRAKDGGVDVRVKITNHSLGISGYLPNNNTVFQVKAEVFPASKIPSEMAPKGVLRQAIRDLAVVDGFYIIAATRDDTSESALDLRLDAMRACLSANGLSSSPNVDFYDARKIADWTEQHPTIVAWVKHQLGKPLVGWRPYSGWAYQEKNADSKYLLDDRVKVFIPESKNGINICAAIDRLRVDLSTGKSVRLVGLSGVGKTRLAQALFDSRIKTNQTALSTDDVLYTDLSDEPSPQPLAMLEALIEDGSQSVLVVDNCGTDTHQKLTELLDKSDNKIGLMTIEYDVRDDLPEATMCYRLEGSSDNVIRHLLRRRYSVLSKNDVDTITSFSDGNARVAFALAATVTKTGELARLRDSELFKRLFHQKNAENEDLLKCAEAASILYSFDGVDDDHASELQKIAVAADVSLPTLQRKIIDLQRRGLVQARGKWRAVLPHAIANRLAAQALETIPKSQIVEIFVNTASNRVARSFSRRLGYLHESEKATEIIREWLLPPGRFSDPANFNSIGHEIFHNIAPVSPKLALSAIDKATSISSFFSVGNSHLTQYAYTLKAIAFEKEEFDLATSILARFILQTPQENKKKKIIIEIFKSLFFCVSSGTNAPPSQRLELVRNLLTSSDFEHQELGLIALDAALEARPFTSVMASDFGARQRSDDWMPESRLDVEAWFVPFIRLAIDIGKQRSEVSERCRSILGIKLIGIWIKTDLKSEIYAALRELALVVSWPHGWFAVKRILRFDLKKCDESDQRELHSLESLLRPRDLPAIIQAHLARSDELDFYFDYEGQDTETTFDRIQRSQITIEELGESAVSIDGLLQELVPQLISTKSESYVLHLGVGVGRRAADPSSILNAVREHIAKATYGTINVFFVRGILSSWHQRSPDSAEKFLDSAVSDAVWSKWIMDLHSEIPMNKAAYDRILQSIRSGNTPSWQYAYLGTGKVIDSLSLEEISKLLFLIKSLPNGGGVFINILAMVVYCAIHKNNEYKDSLAAMCLNLLGSLEWGNALDSHDMSGYRIESILDFSLRRLGSSAAAMKVLSSIIEFVRGEECDYSYRDIIKDSILPYFKHIPLQTLDAIYVPGEDAFYCQVSQLIGNSHSSRDETAVSVIALNVLIDWCNISPPDRYLFAARTCKLFDTFSQGTEQDSSIDHVDDPDLVISEVALAVLANAPDKKAVIECFVTRFRPSIWSGSLAEILKKRAPLLDSFNFNNDHNLRPIIAEARKFFEKLIAAEELYEEERAREQTGSFE